MRKVIYISIFILILTITTACTKPQEQPSPDPQEKIEVTLYYANKTYVETGNEEYDKLIPVKKTIDKDDANFYLSILNELKNPPDQEDAATELFSDITFVDVKVENKIAYVNISSENLHGGSLQEAFLIDQVVYTLTEFDEIDKVQFLVDGEIPESLMGHYSTDEPLGRE